MGPQPACMLILQMALMFIKPPEGSKIPRNSDLRVIDGFEIEAGAGLEAVQVRV